MENKNWIFGSTAKQFLYNLRKPALPAQLKARLEMEENKKCGYYKDPKKWIVFDNRTGTLAVQDFESERQCIIWLKE